MYDYEQIKDIHLEISSLCNAECPICNRRLSGGPKNPIMIERAVTLGEFKAWFPIDLIRRMKQLTLCGNYGDPMTAPDLISILRYFRSINSTCAISMNTNAGGRDAEFWKDLAEVIGEAGRIVFSVDGLEDTNHLYRKGVNWEKVMTAMKAVTSTKKVRTVWEFLVFKHNQHQIAEARKLSEDLGMDEFWPKKAMGFMAGEDGISIIRKLKSNGSFDHYLYSPDDEWQNEAIRKPAVRYKSDNFTNESTMPMQLEDITETFNYRSVGLSAHLETISDEDPIGVKKLDKCQIECSALSWAGMEKSQSVFVSSTGVVFPCCFTASKYYATASYETVQLRNFVESYGEETITLSETKNIKDIIESDIMQTGFVNSWNKNSIEEGKLYTCGTFCGKDTNTEIKSTKESVSHNYTKVGKRTMYKHKELLHLDLETSSLCNALCPVCNRRANGGLKNTSFKETYVSIEKFKEWFSDDFIKQLYGLSMCGNYGDSMTNPDLIPILTYAKSVNPNLRITMNTNGSGRNPEFWQSLGELIGKRGILTFSVDGLEDTNHLYRKGTNWSKIMMAMKNFIKGGGRARWEFLVFKHNQHQIAEARALADELGFDKFFEKKAMGFVHNDLNREVKEGIRVFDTDGSYQYVLEPPENEFTNKIVASVKYEDFYKQTKTMTEPDDIESIIQKIKKDEERGIPVETTPTYIPPKFIKDDDRPLTEWEVKLGNSKIDCMVLHNKSVFVAHDGLVFPCCFTASKYYAYDNEETAQLKDFINSFGRDKISLHHTKLEDIIDGPMFQEKWVENFKDNNVRDKRLRTCSLFCGKETNDEFSETIESIEAYGNES